MRKLAILLAATSTLAIATPVLAQDVSVRIGERHPHHGAMIVRERHPRAAVVIHDRGWHRGWGHSHHAERVIVR